MTDYLRFRADWRLPETVAVYDELPLWSAMAGLLLLRHLPLRRGMRVLDAGCGTGFPLLELAGRLGPASRVAGIDPWRAGLARAREKMRGRTVGNAALVEGDAAAMPFADGVFDLVVSNLGLNNFARPEAAFSEARRVLAPGGRVALVSNLQGHMAEFYEVFAGVLRGRGDAAEALERLEAHVERRATVERIGALLEGAGFRVARVEREEVPMRFADGAALLRHWFVMLAFLDDWAGIVAEGEREEVFARVEAALDAEAERRGGLSLTIPLAYVEAERVG